MKLQEFFEFRKKCFVCGAPLHFQVKDWSDVSKPMTMVVSEVSHFKILKFSHLSLSIFINLQKNVFNIYPNVSKRIDLAIDAFCTKNKTHYFYDSSNLSFMYEEKTWSLIPEISAQEVIRPGNYNIFSLINSYQHNKTEIVFENPYQYPNCKIPLISTDSLSYQDYINKIKMYITFS